MSDRFEATRTNGRTRTISRSPARVVVEMRITWRAALVSPEAGSLSVLRVDLRGALGAGEGAAQRRLDPLGQRGEIRFAVERDIDRAAHQRGAAQPVRIVPENHWTETRRRSTKPDGAPSTSNGGSLPRSIGSDAARRRFGSRRLP